MRVITSNGPTVSSSSNFREISLPSNNLYKVCWNIIVKVDRGPYDLEGYLLLNDTKVSGSNFRVSGAVARCEFITLVGSALISIHSHHDVLSLVLNSHDNASVDVVDASIKMISLSESIDNHL